MKFILSSKREQSSKLYTCHTDLISFCLKSIPKMYIFQHKVYNIVHFSYDLLSFWTNNVQINFILHEHREQVVEKCTIISIRGAKMPIPVKFKSGF